MTTDRITPTPDTIPAGHSDEWGKGWAACRSVMRDEWARWYARGVAARDDSGYGLGIAILWTVALIIGFVAGVIVAEVVIT